MCITCSKYEMYICVTYHVKMIFSLYREELNIFSGTVNFFFPDQLNKDEW